MWTQCCLYDTRRRLYPWDQLKTTFELNESSNLVEIEEPVGLAIAEVSRSRGQVQVRVVACEFEPPRGGGALREN